MVLLVAIYNFTARSQQIILTFCSSKNKFLYIMCSCRCGYCEKVAPFLFDTYKLLILISHMISVTFLMLAIYHLVSVCYLLYFTCQCFLLRGGGTELWRSFHPSWVQSPPPLPVPLSWTQLPLRYFFCCMGYLASYSSIKFYHACFYLKVALTCNKYDPKFGPNFFWGHKFLGP